MSNPFKRQRASSNGLYNPQPIKPSSHSPQTSEDTAQAPEDYQSWVETLSQETVQSLLVRAAQTHPDIARLLKHEVDDLIQRDRARVLNFDHLSKSAWHTINSGGGSGTEQYYAAFDAFESVTQTIKTIQDSCPEHASFGTKKNGLETLRKIGKSICLSNNDTLSHEVRKQFQCNEDVTDTMLSILRSMTEDQLDEVAQSEWYHKLDELIKLAKSYCLFNDTLGDVVREVDGEELSNEEEDLDDEGEDPSEQGEADGS